jgi:hypothetical protein
VNLTGLRAQCEEWILGSGRAGRDPKGRAQRRMAVSDAPPGTGYRQRRHVRCVARRAAHRPSHWNVNAHVRPIQHGQRVEWLYSANREFRPGCNCRYWSVTPNQHDPGRSTGRHDPARDGGASQKLGGSGRRSSPVSNPSGSGRAWGMESGHPREGNNRSPPDKSLGRRPARALLATALLRRSRRPERPTGCPAWHSQPSCDLEVPDWSRRA